VNESNDLVSIIVVAHAYPDWVRECLDSIAAQTHKNFECIVVLDNDPQGQLADAVRGPFANDPRFCFESMPGRRERNHCRNRGIEMARGHWVNVVDGDDFLPPDSLEIRLAAAARHPGSTIFGRVRLWSDGHAGDQLIYQNQYVFNDLRIAWPSHCTLLLERQRLDKVRYPEHVEDGEQAAEFLAGEDVHFLNLLLQENQGMKLLNCNENVYFYRRYPSSSQRLRHRAYFQVIRTILDFHGYPELEDFKYRKALTEKAIYCLLHLALSLARQGQLPAMDEEAEPEILGIAAWASGDAMHNCMLRLQSDMEHEPDGPSFEPEIIRDTVLRAITRGRDSNWTRAIPGHAIPFDPEPITADFQRVRRFHNRHAGETAVLLCSDNSAAREFRAQQQAGDHVLIALGTIDATSCPAATDIDYLVSQPPGTREAQFESGKQPVQFLIDQDAVTAVHQDPLTFHIPGIAVQADGQGFSTDITRRIDASDDLLHGALQIAHYLGFQRTILLGLDPLEQRPDSEWGRREALLGQARQAFTAEGRELFDAASDGPSVACPKWSIASATPEYPVINISYFPAFGPDDELNFSLLRAAWYLGIIAGARIRIFGRELPEELDCQDCYDPACATLYKQLREDGRLVCEAAPTEAGMLEILRGSDAVICWKDNTYVEDVYGEAVCKELRSAGIRVFTMGADERLESSMYVEVSWQLARDRAALIATHKQRFARLRARTAGRRKAFLIATGPSSRSWERFQLEGEDAVTVVCNSVINDDHLMTALEPDIVVFADPIFHFGCSTYAQAFRARLMHMAARHRFSIVIPFRYQAIFTAHMPELAHRVIAIPHVADLDINLDLGVDFRVRTTDNILTFLMIPLAASLARDLYVIGCDGRPLEQDDYFWKHNERTQFTVEMVAIRKAHPSFFRIDYNDYYLRHCEKLEHYARAVELAGGGLFSMWQSHIPALRSRLRLPAPVRSGRIIVSINPDLQDEFGHWLHYDQRLAGTTDDLFVSLASIDLKVNPADLLALPVFSHPMRETRVDASGNKAAKVGEEFHTAMELLLSELPASTRVHAMIYTGDLSYVEALEPVFATLGGRATLAVNLFFTFLD
jgi:glycosyltransferase involved in cell wall biosynthesis